MSAVIRVCEPAVGGGVLLQAALEIYRRAHGERAARAMTLIGVDIDPRITSARRVCERLLQHGVLSKETHETVVRFAPPLVITRAELDASLEQLAKLGP